MGDIKYILYFTDTHTFFDKYSEYEYSFYGRGDYKFPHSIHQSFCSFIGDYCSYPAFIGDPTPYITYHSDKHNAKLILVVYDVTNNKFHLFNKRVIPQKTIAKYGWFAKTFLGWINNRKYDSELERVIHKSLIKSSFYWKENLVKFLTDEGGNKLGDKPLESESHFQKMYNSVYTIDENYNMLYTFYSAIHRCIIDKSLLHEIGPYTQNNKDKLTMVVSQTLNNIEAVKSKNELILRSILSKERELRARKIDFVERNDTQIWEKYIEALEKNKNIIEKRQDILKTLNDEIQSTENSIQKDIEYMEYNKSVYESIKNITKSNIDIDKEFLTDYGKYFDQEYFDNINEIAKLMIVIDDDKMLSEIDSKLLKSNEMINQWVSQAKEVFKEAA